METNCLNCNAEIVQNFCSNCGQKKYKRIDRKYIWDEVQYTTVHMNKGFFYSIKTILRNPGKAARNFINGNRINHYKPIAMIFILTGISSFIAYQMIGLGEMTDKVNAMQTQDLQQLKIMKNVNDTIKTYMSFFLLAMLPFLALFSRWSFKSFGNNFYEHVIINAYILIYSTLLGILVFYPLMYIFKDYEGAVMLFSVLSTFSYLIILPYFYKNFYPEASLKKVLLRVLLFFGLAITALIILGILLVIGGFLFAMLHPEAVKDFIPKPTAT